MAHAATKEARIDLRTTKKQKAFIQRGADTRGQKLSDFVLSSAQEKAEIVLADQREFVLPAARWDAFIRALERPVKQHQRLTRLLTEPSILER